MGIAAGALCGAAGSSLGYLTTQGLKGDPVDPGQLAAAAAVGAAAGALGAGAGRLPTVRPQDLGRQSLRSIPARVPGV